MARFVIEEDQPKTTKGPASARFVIEELETAPVNQFVVEEEAPAQPTTFVGQLRQAYEPTIRRFQEGARAFYEVPEAAREFVREPSLQAGMRMAGGVLGGFKQAVAPIGGAIEQAARGLGLSPQMAETAGDIAEVAVPIGTAKFQQVGKLAKPSTPVARAAQEAIGIPTEAPLRAPATVTRPATVDLSPTPSKLLNQFGRPINPAGRFVIEEVTEPILKQDIHKRIATVAEEVFSKGGLKRDPDRLISDQMTDLIATEKIPLPELNDTLQRHGVSFTEFANELFRPGVRDAAKRLGSLGNLSKRIDTFLQGIPAEERAAYESMAKASSTIDEWQLARNYWQRGSNIFKGLLVSQPATAVRNLISQTGRLPLDTAAEVVDRTVATMFGKAKFTDPYPALESLLNVFHRGNKAKVDEILKDLPKEYNRLFGSYSSDVAQRVKAGAASPVDQAFGQAEKAVDFLNTLNRAQEFHTRRAVFLANMNAGKSVDQAITKALDVTFSLPPNSKAGKAFVELANLPGGVTVIPFPRFIVNSLRYFWEHNPTGFLKLLKPGELKAIANGESQTIGKAVVGTGMLGAAYQLRNSSYAGERWYEIRIPGTDRTIDARAFNPFSAYLFVADLARRQKEGTLPSQLDLQSGLQVLGINARAGTTLSVVNDLDDALRGLGDEKKMAERLKSFGGNIAAGFLTPLQAVQDVLAGLKPTIVRERQLEPFTAPIQARIPGMAEQLPPAVSPTKEGPIMREAPALRQVTGLTLTQPKNPAEKELDRLGFQYKDIFHGTGDREDDRRVKRILGMVVERGLSKIVTDPGYEKLSTQAKKLIVSESLKVMRKTALDIVKAENPDLALRLKTKRVPRRTRELILEQTGKDVRSFGREED